jgi:hypothetical protein
MISLWNTLSILSSNCRILVEYPSKFVSIICGAVIHHISTICTLCTHTFHRFHHCLIKKQLTLWPLFRTTKYSCVAHAQLYVPAQQWRNSWSDTVTLLCDIIWCMRGFLETLNHTFVLAETMYERDAKNKQERICVCSSYIYLKTHAAAFFFD